MCSVNSPCPSDVAQRLIALTLTLVRADDRRSLLQRRYAGEVEVQGATPEAMADAANRLATLLAAEVVRDLRTWQRRGSKQVP